MQPQYAIYITSGRGAHNPTHYEWGGSHITMAGFQEVHGKQRVIEQIAKNSFCSRKAWIPKDMKVEKWGKQWTVVIRSNTLNQVAKALKGGGFSKVKGPKECKTAFHISLPHIKSKSEAQKYAHSLAKKKWFITLVKTNPHLKRCDWTHYYPLGNF